MKLPRAAVEESACAVFSAAAPMPTPQAQRAMICSSSVEVEGQGCRL